MAPEPGLPLWPSYRAYRAQGLHTKRFNDNGDGLSWRDLFAVNSISPVQMFYRHAHGLQGTTRRLEAMKNQKQDTRIATDTTSYYRDLCRFGQVLHQHMPGLEGLQRRKKVRNIM